MSRQNKVNPGRYSQAGRLSPDDLGRERQRQDTAAASSRTPKGRAPRPAWETTAPSSTAAAGREVRVPGRVKVAAARTLIGVTRATAKAVKTATRAAKKMVGAPATRPATPAKAAAKRARKRSASAKRPRQSTS